MFTLYKILKACILSVNTQIMKCHNKDPLFHKFSRTYVHVTSVSIAHFLMCCHLNWPRCRVVFDIYAARGH